MKIKSRWADGRSFRAQAYSGAFRPAWLTAKLRARLALEAAAFIAAAALTVYTAVMTKAGGLMPALAVTSPSAPAASESTPEAPVPSAEITTTGSEIETEEIIFEPVQEHVLPRPAGGVDASTRWFNGRPIRPAGVLRMRVTAYSPDARSCGGSADGITATLHSVETNGFQLAAADPRVLKYGALVSVPGYAGGSVVPVLDCGGKIKGSRLDLLYPTHEEARKWGSKSIAVTVWEYADGKPAPNPRKLR